MRNLANTPPTAPQADPQEIDETNRQRGIDEVAQNDVTTEDRGVFRNDGQPLPHAPFLRRVEREDLDVKTLDDERHPVTPDPADENINAAIERKLSPINLATD